VKLKAEIVSADEQEGGLRRVLNLGHTIGHALEVETGYRALLHGEAVAWGMIAATNIALTVGRTDSVTAGRIADAVLSLGRLPELKVSARKILARLQADKKTQNGAVHFVLPREIGKVEIASDVPDKVVLDAVEELRRLSLAAGSGRNEDADEMTRAAETPRSTVMGAAPEGASDPRSAARAVREMFTSIAPRYDLLNHVLSCNVDRLWWRRTARTFSHIFAQPDCACSRSLLRHWRHDLSPCASRQGEGKCSPQILGADFSHAMLQRALSKSVGQSAASAESQMPRWIEADALSLPFPDQHFNLVTSAFGFRNLADYDAGLREIARVLTPGGECGILDFSEPKGLMGASIASTSSKCCPAWVL
jgi:demethylmenaquinone methyltransferase / 2-methoxy-6-polyprenyl-1,4-benzoquinol methylase